MLVVKRKESDSGSAKLLADKQALADDKRAKKSRIQNFQLGKLQEAPIQLNPFISDIREYLRHSIWTVAKEGIACSFHEASHIKLTMQLDGWAVYPDTARALTMGDVVTYYDLFFKRIKTAVVVYPVLYATPHQSYDGNMVIDYKQCYDHLVKRMAPDAEVSLDCKTKEHAWGVGIDMEFNRVEKKMYRFTEPSRELKDMTDPRHMKPEIIFRNFMSNHGQS